MSQNRLEEYLGEMGKGLKSLPVVEQERELAEARQHLEALISARREAGDDTQTAIKEAIRQFGNAQENGAQLRQASRRGRLKNLPPLVVVTLYSLAASTAFGLLMRYIVRPMLLTMLGPEPADLYKNVAHSPIVTPSLVLGVAALLFLFIYQGMQGSLKDATSRTTQAGAAVSYLLVKYTLNLTVSTVLVNYVATPALFGVLNAGTFTSAFLAAWYVGWRTEVPLRATSQAVTVAVLLGPVLSILNLSTHSMPLHDLPPFLTQYLGMTLPLFLCVPISLLAARLGAKMRRSSVTHG